ncbi:MAG: hypothetical protein HY321_03300 [Armatimonadetes bacterium]|nr:hypothetical protein [Armatimonadota bacterium]
MRITETPCPWCRHGRVVIHAPEEPWIVREDTGEVGRRGPKGRPARFQTAPIPWFSCTECAMSGTLSYLRMMLTGGVRRYLNEAALQRRASAYLREGEVALPGD